MRRKTRGWPSAPSPPSQATVRSSTWMISVGRAAGGARSAASIRHGADLWLVGDARRGRSMIAMRPVLSTAAPAPRLAPAGAAPCSRAAAGACRWRALRRRLRGASDPGGAADRPARPRGRRVRHAGRRARCPYRRLAAGGAEPTPWHRAGAARHQRQPRRLGDPGPALRRRRHARCIAPDQRGFGAAPPIAGCWPGGARWWPTPRAWRGCCAARHPGTPAGPDGREHGRRRC